MGTSPGRQSRLEETDYRGRRGLDRAFDVAVRPPCPHGIADILVAGWNEGHSNSPTVEDQVVGQPRRTDPARLVRVREDNDLIRFEGLHHLPQDEPAAAT